MLVLSRKTGQTIQIDGQIQISVISVSGNRVKIGIEAPQHMRIFRGELNDSHVLSFSPPTQPEYETADCYCV